MNSGARGAEKVLTIENGQVFVRTKYMTNDADSKNPIFIFAGFLCPGHLRGLGVSLGRIFGSPSIEPFLVAGV